MREHHVSAYFVEMRPDSIDVCVQCPHFCIEGGHLIHKGGSRRMPVLRRSRLARHCTFAGTCSSCKELPRRARSKCRRNEREKLQRYWIQESYDEDPTRSVATFVTGLYVWTQMLELQRVDSQELVIAIPQACADQYE